jgi:hypothetical protein
MDRRRNFVELCGLDSFICERELTGVYFQKPSDYCLPVKAAGLCRLLVLCKSECEM